MTIGGRSLLYTLNRSNGHIDSDELVVHVLSPTALHPLADLPALDDGPTDSMGGIPEPHTATAFTTTGLINPDGILAAIPGTSPQLVIYEEKDLNRDLAFPANQRCATKKKGSPTTGP